MAVFSIIGIGPGAREYVLPVAWEEAKKADTLIGSPRCLDLFRDSGKRFFPLDGEGFKEAISYIREHRKTERLALLVSGDPGFHSYLAVIRRSFSSGDYRVVPGVSSLQLAFARIGLPWQDALLLSAHGRDIPKAAAECPLFFLTDKANTPSTIAESLLAAGMENRIAWVLENLSYPDERIEKTRIGDLAAAKKDYALCVMIIE